MMKSWRILIKFEWGLKSIQQVLKAQESLTKVLNNIKEYLRSLEES